MTAGESTAKKFHGGFVNITAGEGSSTNMIDGGDGGTVYITAGNAMGDWEHDPGGNGGDVALRVDRETSTVAVNGKLGDMRRC